MVWSPTLLCPQDCFRVWIASSAQTQRDSPSPLGQSILLSDTGWRSHDPRWLLSAFVGLMRWISNTVAVQRSVVFFKKKTNSCFVSMETLHPSLRLQARASGPPLGLMTWLWVWRSQEMSHWQTSSQWPASCFLQTSVERPAVPWVLCVLCTCINSSVIHCRPNGIINEVAELWVFLIVNRFPVYPSLSAAFFF